MESRFSFAGGTWTAVAFGFSDNAPTQSVAITRATEHAVANRQPVLIYWSGVEDGEALVVPWAVVSRRGSLIMLTKTQIKQAL